MSRTIKANCQLILKKINQKLIELGSNSKLKKSPLWEKTVSNIFNDFKFLDDELSILWSEIEHLQKTCRHKTHLINDYQRQLQLKESENKRLTSIMKSKCNKLSKQLEFRSFTGKNSKQTVQLQRSKSMMLKKSLDEIQQELKENTLKVCNKVRNIKENIENEEKTYALTQRQCIQAKPKQLFNQLDFSDIMVNTEILQSPFKNNKLLNLDPSPSKTKKKLGRAEQSCQLVEKNQKKHQLAKIIACQIKTAVSKQKYLSTDF